MTEPVRIEDELTPLDFEPQCEIMLWDTKKRCTRAASALVDIHGHCYSVSYQAPWRRMLMCAECLDAAKRIFERDRVGGVLICNICDEHFAVLTDIIPLVRPL